MGFFSFRRGLDIALPGTPVQALRPAPPVGSVALYGADFALHRAEMLVKPGDVVERGQAVFLDRKRPEIMVTSPVAGKIRTVEIGAKRRLDFCRDRY